MRFRTLLLPVAVLGLLAACGDNAVTSDSGAPSSTAAGAVPKPEVKLPSAIPTSLVVTDLTDGTGEAAANGDTVIVYYVGVRSADGKEFDNSYDRGEPLPVILGSGGVIAGWEQGLVGIKSGGRRQLDIPADLAYGDAPPSTDVIQPGDALSFVIDVVTIIHKPDPADTPDISIPPTRTRRSRRSQISSWVTALASSPDKPWPCSFWLSAQRTASCSTPRGM